MKELDDVKSAARELWQKFVILLKRLMDEDK
jgi:hypothetical protein